jgi:DNA-binding IclR family transcriptional regulator
MCIVVYIKRHLYHLLDIVGSSGEVVNAMAVQSCRSVQRAAQILKVMAAEPMTEFSLSQLARRIDVHRSTCQTLMLALSAEGLVRRRAPDATYRLGATLLELGEAARASLGVVDVADHELVRLRDEFGASAIAGVVAGDTIVIAASHPVMHPFGYTVTAGTRLPLHAPLGTIYVAWSDDATVEAWLSRGESSGSAVDRARTIRELETVRNRGWSATVRPFEESGGGRASTREATDDDLDRDRLSTVGISAPVWDERGALACSIALAAFPSDLEGKRVRQIGAAVAETAQAITAAIGGRVLLESSP